MNALLGLGINDNDLKFMLEQEPKIIKIKDSEIIEKIELLLYVGCSEKSIRHIIVSNPNYLSRNTNDILKLIEYLKEMDFSSISSLFDSNPYFLNYDVFEIKDYISKQIISGKKIKYIIDEIEENSYVIDEE